MSARRVYLDYTATTPLDERVAAAMRPYLSEIFGNANALYREGREAFTALTEAHHAIARSIGARMPQEVIATSGGTESDVSALIGIAEALASMPKGKGRTRIITSSMEHHAILEPAKRLGRLGFAVERIDPRPNGFVHPDDLAALIGTQGDVALVSIMSVNNETGCVQPIRELSAVAHAQGALFHTDAVQALGKIPFDVRALDVDAASFSAHKLYGPKGVGALYLRKGTPFAPYLPGGGQEGGLRSGTSNVAGLVGFARACELATADLPADFARAAELRERLVKGLAHLDPAPTLPVDAGVCTFEDTLHSPYILSCLFDGYESETLILRLDERGYCVSGGSACSSRSLEPSHVMRALSIPTRRALGLIRISIGRDTDDSAIDGFLSALQDSLSGRDLA